MLRWEGSSVVAFTTLVLASYTQLALTQLQQAQRDQTLTQPPPAPFSCTHPTSTGKSFGRAGPSTWPCHIFRTIPPKWFRTTASTGEEERQLHACCSPAGPATFSGQHLMLRDDWLWRGRKSIRLIFPSSVFKARWSAQWWWENCLFLLLKSNPGTGRPLACYHATIFLPQNTLWVTKEQIRWHQHKNQKRKKNTKRIFLHLA